MKIWVKSQIFWKYCATTNICVFPHFHWKEGALIIHKAMYAFLWNNRLTHATLLLLIRAMSHTLNFPFTFLLYLFQAADSSFQSLCPAVTQSHVMWFRQIFVSTAPVTELISITWLKMRTHMVYPTAATDGTFCRCPFAQTQVHVASLALVIAEYQTENLCSHCIWKHARLSDLYVNTACL